jgi:hypothetical protein
LQRRHCAFPIERLAFAASILRHKRDDSINRTIAETGHYSQRLDACSALREAGCGFFAARFALLVDFYAGMALLPNRGHATATPSP